MSVKYNIIVRDVTDTKKNAKSLSDAELYFFKQKTAYVMPK